MKIRKGFISNSSSSSFICDVCGDNQSGWDLSIRDAGMYRCENDHTFCDTHKEKPTEEAATKWINSGGYGAKSYNEWYSNAKEDGEIDEDFSNVELVTMFAFEDCNNDPDEVPSVFCPICGMKHVTDGELLLYLLKKSGISKQEVVAEIKSRFNDYRDFYAELFSKTAEPAQGISQDDFMLFLMKK